MTSVPDRIGDEANERAQRGIDDAYELGRQGIADALQEAKRIIYGPSAVLLGQAEPGRRATQVQAEADARAQQMIEDARVDARRIIVEGTRKALDYMAAEVANRTVQ